MTRIYASSGGGIRVGASFGAVLEGERQSRFHPNNFDWYVGTSAGALDAVLTANGWTGKQKKELFLNTDFARFFSPFLVPFGIRKALAVLSPISLHKLAVFIDSLQEANPYGPALQHFDSLLVNSVDAEENVQVVFCQQPPDWLFKPPKGLRIENGAFHRRTLGTVLTRSMVLPGLRADHPRWQDGGVAQNPLLSVLPKDAAITLIHLGYAGLVRRKGDTIPKSALEQALYDYEFKAYSFTEHLISGFSKLTVIRPEIYDIDSASFGIPYPVKEDMIGRARANTREQWVVLPKVLQ